MLGLDGGFKGGEGDVVEGVDAASERVGLPFFVEFRRGEAVRGAEVREFGEEGCGEGRGAGAKGGGDLGLE